MPRSVEESLKWAVENNVCEDVRRILRENPGIKVSCDLLCKAAGEGYPMVYDALHPHVEHPDHNKVFRHMLHCIGYNGIHTGHDDILRSVAPEVDCAKALSLAYMVCPRSPFSLQHLGEVESFLGKFGFL